MHMQFVWRRTITETDTHLIFSSIKLACNPCFVLTLNSVMQLRSQASSRTCSRSCLFSFISAALGASVCRYFFPAEVGAYGSTPASLFVSDRALFFFQTRARTNCGTMPPALQARAPPRYREGVVGAGGGEPPRGRGRLVGEAGCWGVLLSGPARLDCARSANFIFDVSDDCVVA